MKLSHEVCYKIVQEKDARFDGVFYTAVKTTGIYCRPVCKVPAPKVENCEFYGTAAEAEAAGYRPCLRCRPEMAPAYSEFEQDKLLFEAMMSFFETHQNHKGIVGACAEELGISPRHIRRIFNKHMQVSPREYIMTQRLLKAKMLLSDTTLSVEDIAYRSGFGSRSRLNAALKKHYQLTPSAVRKSRKAKQIEHFKGDGQYPYFEVALSYRPPYDWEHMMSFFKVRAIPHVEHVTDTGVYQRSMRIQSDNMTYEGWIEVRPDVASSTAKLRISASLEPVTFNVIQRVRRTFDLDLNPLLLPEGIPKETRLPGCFDPFEMCCRAVLGQQITVKAATTLSGRVAHVYGTAVQTPWPEVNRHFPAPEQVCMLGDQAHDQAALYDGLGKLGVIRSRSFTILEIAKGLESNQIHLSKGSSVEKLKADLMQIKGIGAWTAEYVSMRALSWPDAFPVSDLGLKHALMDILTDASGRPLREVHDLSKYKLNKVYEKAAADYANQYTPWRSYLTIHLWKALA